MRNHYASGVNSSGALVAVEVEDGGSADRTARTGNDMTGEWVIPTVEEELVVGKREVDRGNVRVYSHVTERDCYETRLAARRRAGFFSGR